jgi:hypothetical protein
VIVLASGRIDRMSTNVTRHIRIFAAVSAVAGAAVTWLATLDYYVTGETCIDAVFFFVGMVCTERWSGPSGWHQTPLELLDVFVGLLAAGVTFVALETIRRLWYRWD